MLIAEGNGGKGLVGYLFEACEDFEARWRDCVVRAGGIVQERTDGIDEAGRREFD